MSGSWNRRHLKRPHKILVGNKTGQLEETSSTEMLGQSYSDVSVLWQVFKGWLSLSRCIFIGFSKILLLKTTNYNYLNEGKAFPPACCFLSSCSQQDLALLLLFRSQISCKKPPQMESILKWHQNCLSKISSFISSYMIKLVFEPSPLKFLHNCPCNSLKIMIENTT